MLNRVVVPVMPLAEQFELGVACEVFGFDRSDTGLPVYDFSLIAAVPGPIRTRFGYSFDLPHELDQLDDADLIILPAGGTETIEDGSFVCGSADRVDIEPLLQKLRSAVARGVRVASLCNGAFILGQAGLLDGRNCTTHWRHADRLSRLYPTAHVDPNVLYVDDDPVLTSAGTAAGIDLCLYIVRKEQGSKIANEIARRMVVPPHRDGGQGQYVTAPVQPAGVDTLAPILDWMIAHLDEDLSVHRLAVQANMSERTFARRFHAETGTTPTRWSNDQRVLIAQNLLENSDLSIDFIADRVGFGSTSVMRQHFMRLRCTTPHSYRRAFRSAPSTL